VLSVGTVRAYKPRPEVYALVTKRFGIAAERVAFVSSNRWDVMGAAAFGFRPVWVNRARLPDEYAEHAPAHIVADLTALPALAW
jgi:2-haloacid dehalogenase